MRQTFSLEQEGYILDSNGQDLIFGYVLTTMILLKGTIFENTHLDIRMWLYAMNLVVVAKKGFSACQWQRELY